MDNDKIVPVGEILVYQTEDGKTRVECRFEQETVWLSQALIGELFQVSVPTVNEHLKNIFEEAELTPEANYSEIPNSSPGRTAGGVPADRTL